MPKLFSIVLAAAFFSSSLSAQSVAVGEKRTRGETMWMRLIKFRPGTEAIRADYRRHAAAAFRASGVPVPIIIRLQTGPWDELLVVRVPEGGADLDYDETPTDAKFMNALAKEMGSLDAANKLWADYKATWERSEGEIGYALPVLNP